ncbi:ATP-dependent Lhr-like helicase [Glycomyces artemisiae]|uniref:ATP-dependent Lhr-like helicase n=1 Tax=Glycomyces artemisiae TaxID=1076443 RepID=A0A2T0UP59_9ACTN|nr:ATP-dependent Lhr-like helicase [Glycomyces artemisiae]
MSERFRAANRGSVSVPGGTIDGMSRREPNTAPHPSLARFSPATASWFAQTFGDPTPAQQGAWEALAEDRDVLVVAPTGSGKTLAAFLSALDALATAPVPAEPKERCRVLYISPLKALGVDVERNLAAPRDGIRAEARRLGLPEPDVRTAIRSGDTPQAERRSIANRPPDILITTPESLFLMLTSGARDALAGVETVILDEVHAVAGTKRGAHLALSLERLDARLARPARRIGLSATVRPVAEVARFLSPRHDVAIVQPPSEKRWDLQVVVPVEDMAALGDAPVAPTASAARSAGSIWPHVEERIVDLVEAHRSTIVFANARRVAERLSNRLNEIEYERRHGEPLPESHGPAAAMGGSGAAAGAPPVLSRTHHGSISKEQRAEVEGDLKAGRLPAVVATSSLELGIDMGAVDLVVQVEAPPSVASGLQRVGRAGHQVGAVSRGVFFPKVRSDLIQSAVVAERMKAGAIEALRVPANPLDVLAQQLVAMAAMDEWDVGDLLDLVRRAAPFATLPDSAFDAVLDMLAGRYPSDAFAELRPRLVWDRNAGTVTGRPGAQRLAVTSGGTIPDRGLFGVFLTGAATGRGGGRVGELDEEMVYESRVGDVFTLGTSSWRIEEITRDRVMVSPAPGVPGRLPFWHGDGLGRPLELGRALGAFVRELSSMDDEAAHARLAAAGLDDSAARNAIAYLAEQREATGLVPDDRTVLIERFRDETGDWRVVIHSPFGAQVHAPWALALGERLRDRHGLDPQVMHHDDGIVLRLPDTGEAEPALHADDLAFDPAAIGDTVTRAVSGSSLFASRFREAASRALLLPHRQPGKRQPLWQQRLRSSQLLEVAGRFPTFPIILEAVREVLQDVYDVPGLTDLMADLRTRDVRLVEVTTVEPSPFARSLLFGYVAQFMYEGDTPLAERRAAALSLDSRLLADLLGQVELRDLFDPGVLADVEAEIQRRTYPARDAESVADLLRVLGPLTPAELAERGAEAAWAETLEAAGRAIRVDIAGHAHWAAVEDAGRLRDALGTVIPAGLPAAFTEPADDPLGDLLARYARTHGPFTTADAAARFGLGGAVAERALRDLGLVEGEFRPGGEHREWCDADVLRRLRRRSLAALRKELEPVPPAALAEFLPRWQHVGGKSAEDDRLEGVDGLARAIEQLQGAAVPASALESLILPSRVADYRPAMLDELTSSGEVLWAGAGSLPGNDGWVALYPAETAPLLLPPPGDAPTGLHAAILDALDGGYGLFYRQLADRVREHTEANDADLTAALWDLAWTGRVANDTLAPLRALLGSGRTAGSTAHRARRAAPRARYGGGWRDLRQQQGPVSGPTAAGRWSLLPAPEPDPTVRAHALAHTLLDRHGVVTRGAVAAEGVEGGFAKVYRVLSVFEESGRARRGYVVDGLGAAQFAMEGAVDRLRAMANRADGTAVVLAAADPANAYGAALPWPDTDGHKPGRKAGSLVVLVGGELALYVERGGRTLIAWPATDAADLSADPRLSAAAAALADAVREGRTGPLHIERVNDAYAPGSTLAAALQEAGFHATPQGFRLRPLGTQQRQVLAPRVEVVAEPCGAGPAVDLGEQLALAVERSGRRDGAERLQQCRGLPVRQREPLQLPLQVPVVGARAPVDREQVVEEVPQALGRVEPGGEDEAVAVVLGRPVEQVHVAVEALGRECAGRFGAERPLLGDECGDPAVEPVEDDLAARQRVPGEPRHPRGPELGVRDDHQVELVRSVPMQRLQFARGAVGEHDPQVVVGALGGEPVVGVRSDEDQPDDRGVRGRGADELVVRQVGHRRRPILIQ